MISVVVAIGRNYVIGKDNALPWHYKEDLKFFKELTINGTVVMGRKTFESIISRNNKILPKRHNVVVTRDTSFNYPDVEVVNDFDEYLQLKKNDEANEIFIIGGSEIFISSMDYVDRLYITWINKDYPGDTYFPNIDLNKYKKISEKETGELTFSVYERIN